MSQAAHVKRTGFIEGTPASLINTAFDTDAGKAATVATDTQVFVVLPERVIEADPNTPELLGMQAQIATRIEQTMSDDLV